MDEFVQPEPIHVDDEYGDLREVIVGRANSLFPDVEHAAWAAEGLKVLPEHEAQKALARSGRSARDLPKFELMEAANDALIAALEARGITVHRVSFGNHTEDGGSIRCATHPLVRRLAGQHDR